MEEVYFQRSLGSLSEDNQNNILLPDYILLEQTYLDPLWVSRTYLNFEN